MSDTFTLQLRLYVSTPLSVGRLLSLDGSSGAIHHRRFTDLPELLCAGDLLVFNNTRVLPARLFGVKETGGRVEILIERMTGEQSALAQIRASKTPKAGGSISFDDKASRW